VLVLCWLLIASLPGTTLASTAEDAPDVVFTQRILDKAAELGNDPVLIYEFVRNEMRFEPYFGIMKGPEGTLVSGGGNDYDLAALLVSLLRASGTPARFVRGRIEVPFDDMSAWLGFDEALPAANLMNGNRPPAWNGTSLVPVVDTGISQVRLHHVWVEAEIPMARYRGSGADPRGKAWIPLDPSFKMLEVPPDPGLPLGTPPLDFGFDAPEGLYSEVHAQLPLELYENKVRAYLADNPPVTGPVSVDDVLLEPTVRKVRAGVIPNALPYAVLATPTPRRAASLVQLHENPPTGWPAVSGTDGAEEYRWKRSVHVCTASTGNCVTAGSKLIEFETWGAAWEGKPVLLHFPPATSNVPESGGYASCTGTDSLPIRVTPTLLADDQVVATAADMNLCTDVKLSVVQELAAMGALGGTVRSDHTVGAGGIYLAGFDSHAASPARTADAAEALVEAADTFPIAFSGDEPFVDLDRDQNKDAGEIFLASHFEAQKALTGGLLHLANAWYYERGWRDHRRIAALHQERVSPRPASGVVSAGRTISYAYDFPFAIQPANLLVDIKGVIQYTAARDTGLAVPCCGGSFELSGHNFSALEHAVWEEIAGAEAISTVKGFQVLKVGFDRELLVIKDLAEAEAATASCSTGSGICTDIDPTTYCIIKNSFADSHPWNAPDWDATCPAVPASGEYTELRVMKESSFDYHSFNGYVYYRTGASNASYSITPGAGGGYVTDFTYPDIFTADLFQSDPIASSISSYSWDYTSLSYNSPLNYSNYAGDPVSVFNGSYFEIHTDLEIPGPGGMDLRLVRAYSSRLEYAGSLGHGWIHTYDQHLRIESGEDDRVVWVTETGAEVPWDDSSPSTSPLELEAQPWSHDELRRNADDSYTLTTKGGTVFQFAAAQGGHARLESIRDRNGNLIQCSYDTAGLLDFVTDAAGRILDFTYDANDHLSEIDDDDWFGGSGGRRWRYTVDTNGDLVEYMDPVQSAIDDASPGAGNPWRYVYYTDQANPDLDHNLKCWIKPESRPGGITPSLCGDPAADGHSWMFFDYYSNDTVYQHTDALGRTTTFSYNYFRKRTDVAHPDGSVETHFYDGYGNVTRFQDANGEVSEYVFDDSKRERVAEYDPFGNEMTATYDADGNLESRTNRLGETESWTYNSFGQPTSHTNFVGDVREWEYDARGNLLRELAEVDGELTLLAEHRYDARGNRIETIAHSDPEGGTAPTRTRVEYDSEGVGIVRMVDALGKIVRFETDALGRPTRVERDRTVEHGPMKILRPVSVEIVYDEQDRAVAVAEPGPVVHEAVFDANGLVVERRELVPDPDPNVTAPADERTSVTNAYDTMDRLVQTANALGHASSFEYDARDRVIRATTPMGRSVERRYDLVGNLIEEIDPSGAIFRKEYDAAGRPVRTIDPLGRVLETFYDAEGRPTRVVQQTDSGERVLEETEYDPLGNPEKTIDGEEREVSRTFDELGRVRTVTLPTVLDRFGAPQTATTELRYDLAGRLIERLDAEGRTNTLRYDRLGRLIETRDGLGRGRFFSYDEVGNLVAHTDPTGSEVRFEYDDRGLLRRRYSTSDASIDDHFTYDGFGRQTVARNALTTLTRRYDALDRVVAATDPLAGTVQLVYDADGRRVQEIVPAGSHGFPSGVSVHYQYDERNLLAAIFDPVAGTWRFEYDAAGRLVRRSDPSGFERRVDYTPEGFMDTVEVVDAAGALLQRHHYRGYDALGNPSFIDHSDGGPDETTEIVYDAWSRVREVTYPTAETEVFDYDRVGNRIYHLQRSGLAYSLPVDAADQLVAQVREDISTTIATFDYDGAGRLAEVRNGDGTAIIESYTYDALNRLTSFGAAGALLDQLAYAPTGSRYRHEDISGAEDYYFAALGVEWHSGTAVRRIDAGGLDRAVAEVQETQTVGLYRDGGGNVTATSDASQITSRRTYEAFGATRTTTVGVPTKRGFASKVSDSVTGHLLYMRARHYDVRYGRFLQQDPLGIEADQLYTYAANNPYRFHDPLGLSPISIGGSTPLFGGTGSSFSDFSSQSYDFGNTTLPQVSTPPSYNFANQSQSGGGSTEQTGPSTAFVAGVATNAAGLAVGGGEIANVQGGQWRVSSPLKDGTRPFYDQRFHGNQYTGGRNAVLRRGAAFRLAGRAFFGLGTALSIGDAYQGNISPVQAGQDVTFGAIGTFGGPLGLAVSGSYFGSQAAVQFFGLDPAALRAAGPQPSGY
jgi:RHS repeat-associated protein